MPAKLDRIDANESEEKQKTIKEKPKTGDKNSTEFGFLLCSKAIQYVNPEDFFAKILKENKNLSEKVISAFEFVTHSSCNLFTIKHVEIKKKIRRFKFVADKMTKNAKAKDNTLYRKAQSSIMK